MIAPLELMIFKILLMVSHPIFKPNLTIKFVSLGESGFGDDEEFEITASGQDAGDDKFDHIVGVLQEILLEDEFGNMTKTFTTKYCMEFEANEENKLSYTTIFKEY